MKYKILIIAFILVSFTIVFAKQPLIIPIYNTNETCAEQLKLWFIDANNDNIFEFLYYSTCNNNSIAFSLVINTTTVINIFESAFLMKGNLNSKDFSIFIFDSINMKFTHKIYFDSQISKAILSDYSGEDNGQTINDISDTYFSTYIQGSFVRLIKKTDISIKAIKLCNLEGIVLDNKQIYDNQSEYFFDLFGQPSGMYFIWILTNDKVFVKKIIYTP